VHELAFLINPISGGGVGKKVFRRLGEVLDSFGLERSAWVAEFTDAKRLAEQTDGLLQSSRKLVAVGGDGTIGMVLDSVRRLRLTTTIGLIPLGTGNDLGRALGIYRVYNAKGLIACLKQLLKAPSRPFDLWDVGNHATLVSYLSMGLDAAVLRTFDKARKQGRLRGGSFGNKCYYLKAFFGQLGYHLPQGASARIETLEGDVELPLGGERVFLAANINSYAAGAHPFTGSRFDDGMLEIAVFDSAWEYALVTMGARGFPPLAYWMRRRLRRYHAKKVVLTFPSETPVQLDGEDFTSENLGETTLTVSFATRVHLLDLRSAFYALF